MVQHQVGFRSHVPIDWQVYLTIIPVFTMNVAFAVAQFVHTPLSFLVQPLNQTVIEYDGVELRCMVCSSLTPTFSWAFTRKGSEQSIVSAHNPLTSDYLIKLGERSQVLIIREAEWKYEGVYKCVASTDNSTVHTEASLNVLGRKPNNINSM